MSPRNVATSVQPVPKSLRRLWLSLRGGDMPPPCIPPACQHAGKLEPGTNVEAIHTESQIDGRKETVLWHEQDGSHIVLMADGKCYRLREGQFIRVPHRSDAQETAASDAGAD
jgi:hypothetical protein